MVLRDQPRQLRTTEKQHELKLLCVGYYPNEVKGNTYYTTKTMTAMTATSDKFKMPNLDNLHSVVMYRINGDKDRLTPQQFTDIISPPTPTSAVSIDKPLCNLDTYSGVTISSTKLVQAWFSHLLAEERLNFHPDNDFNDYVSRDGTKTYTKTQADKRNAAMKDAFTVCNDEGVDIYGYAIEAFDKYEADEAEIPVITDKATLRIATAYLIWLAGSKFDYHIDDTVYDFDTYEGIFSDGISKRLQRNIDVVRNVFTDSYDNDANKEMWIVYGAIKDAKNMLEARFSALTDITVYGDKVMAFRQTLANID